MFILFTRTSTWLLIEIIATCILAVLNMIIPMLMIFPSYRSLSNFYLSSSALSSSLINCLYLFYLVQTFRSKLLSENNCRALYYLQTCCIVVLAYTVTAMHTTFIICLFPSLSSSSSKQHSLFLRCIRSCRICLSRLVRRFCFCFVILVWAISFTSTIPLLYSIDSNEKSPKPVYCPGTTQITYLEEWFDINRFIQTVLFNLIPLLICIFLSLIAVFKLITDFLLYFYSNLKISKCFPCRKQSRQSFCSCLPISFLRSIVILSCCLLACIYPIVMRFYLVYFSVIIPLLFAVFNYSLGQLTTTEQETILENPNINLSRPSNVGNNLLTMNIDTIIKPNEQLELQSPFIVNLSNQINETPTTPSSSSTIYATPQTNHQSLINNKRKSFANHLYENTRNILMK